MTTVYGVTFVGARDQIERQLREKTDIPPESRFQVSSYVAKQVRSLSCNGPPRDERLIDTCSYWRSVQRCQGDSELAHPDRQAYSEVDTPGSFTGRGRLYKCPQVSGKVA
jgi:DNA-dependent RNA polymerase